MRRQSDLSDIYGVKKLKSNPLEADNDTAETGFRHSDSYHRFFRGYTEIRREKANGKIGVERYYTQPWIVNTASAQAYWMIRLMYGMLLYFSVSIYIWAMCQDILSNRMWFVAIPGVLAIVFLVLLTVTIFNYVTVHKKMTLWEHESSTNQLKLFSRISSGCLVLVAVVKLVCLLIYRENIGGELKSIVAVLISAVFAVALYFMEREVVYTKVPNHTILPEGEAHEIW